MPKDELLLDFINKTSPEKLQVDEDLGYGFVRLNITEAQRRQAKDDIRRVEDIVVELLRNSRDANATKIHIASWKSGNLRNILFADNGDGIPDELQKKIFEARVTSKLNKANYDSYGLHGRGMALYSIALNCREAKVFLSKPNKGTVIKVAADTLNLTEKANQSTWPVLDSKGKIKEGPKNIIRHCAEFNLRNKAIDIYLGSPTEILNNLMRGGGFFIQKTKAKDFHKEAIELGFDISFRNCQRILHQQVPQLQPVLSNIANRNIIVLKPKMASDNCLSSRDMHLILEQTKQIVNEFGQSYFIKVSESANIKKVGNKLKISLPLEIEE